MTHTHGMDPVRREAERETKKEIWQTALVLFDQVSNLHIIRSAHIVNFPKAALTCEQLDKLDGALDHIDWAREILRDLSEELPNKY